MIGVAFALHGTFGAASGAERIAFGRAVHQFAEQRKLEVDSGMRERIARFDDAELTSPAALSEAFSTVLGPNLLSGADSIWFEALFRMAVAVTAGECFRPYEDGAPALRQLAKMQVPRVALGAGWPTIDQRKADVVGFEGPIVFAQDLDVSPSSPAAFARLAEALRLPADRIWFVGSDVRSGLLPAAAAGLHTVWVNRAGAQFPPGRPAPDATLTSLAQLFDVLREPYTRGLLALRHILRTALDWRPGHSLPIDDDPAATERRADEEDAR